MIGSLRGPKVAFFTGDRLGIPSVDFTFIVFEGCSDTFFAEDTSVFLGKSYEDSLL